MMRARRILLSVLVITVAVIASRILMAPDKGANYCAARNALYDYLAAQKMLREQTGTTSRSLRALARCGLDPAIAAAQVGGAEPPKPYHGYYFSEVMPQQGLLAFPAISGV